MHTSPRSLFSIRNVILVIVTVLTARSFSATIGQLDNFSRGHQPFALQSLSIEQSATPLFNSEILLHGWVRDMGVDANFVPEERSVAAEIMEEHGLFVVSYGPGVSARTWLSYLAPNGMSFDMTMENAANSLDLIVEFSQAPFEVQVSLASTDGSAASYSFRQEATYSRSKVEIPFEVFQGVDLERVSSLELELFNIAGEGAPDIVISELAVGANNIANVPEPSSVILVLLASSAACLRRRRERL